MRRFKSTVHVLTLLPLYLVASVCFGLAVFPAIALYRAVALWFVDHGFWVQALASGLSVGVGYFIYGFTLILIVPAFNALLRARPKPGRGTYYSLGAVKWYIHNGLTYLARYTFLEFITPTPFNIMFYRLMGMKIGAGTQLNTSHISDPSLITLGEKVTVGGSAAIIAHYGMGGYLVIAPVVIGPNATIGLRATVLGGVEIGEGAKILPNSVVLPKTKVPAGETWGGVPATRIDISSLHR